VKPGPRIVMLTTFFPPYNFGGDGIGVQRLAVALAARGCEVTVVHEEDAFVLLNGGEPNPAPAETRFEVIGLRSRHGLISNLLTQQLGRPVVHGPRIQKILDEKRPDIVWFHNVSLVGGPGLLAYGDALKIYEAHEHWLVCPTHVLWRYNRETCDAQHCLSCTLSYKRPPQAWRWTDLLAREAENVDLFIAKSEFSQGMHQKFGFEPPMQVIPYFLPDAPPLAGDEAQRPQARPYFLFVGRLEKIKGVQDVLPAFEGEDGPDLLIVGSGEYEAELKRLAAGKPRVKFTGRLPPEALAQYYAAAEALIVPSVCFETFGIILIEAFRNGTPVIARRIGPFPEIVAKGGGLLFSDAAELTAAMGSLLSDKAERQRLSTQARNAFDTHWREDVVVERYIDQLSRAAHKKGDRRALEALEGLT
jgi:glycosyltransferase involved in cell wall biosynthesis